MKFLGIDTAGVKLVGKFTFTNTTSFPLVVSLWQTSPLYYRIIPPSESWSTDCGSVWFTVKVWLYNGSNNVNPTIKYSLLASNIVGFAALGAVGLTATAIASSYGVSKRKNLDWDAWVAYVGLARELSDAEYVRGAEAIRLCEFSGTGYYAGRHPHLFISGGPVPVRSEKRVGGGVTLEWREVRVDKVPFEHATLPLISTPSTYRIRDSSSSESQSQVQSQVRGHGYRIEEPRHHYNNHDEQEEERLVRLIDNDTGTETETASRGSERDSAPPMPMRGNRNGEGEVDVNVDQMQQQPRLPRRPPVKVTETSDLI